MRRSFKEADLDSITKEGISQSEVLQMGTVRPSSECQASEGIQETGQRNADLDTLNPHTAAQPASMAAVGGE